jgi:acetyl esterase/lipase
VGFLGFLRVFFRLPMLLRATPTSRPDCMPNVQAAGAGAAGGPEGEGSAELMQVWEGWQRGERSAVVPRPPPCSRGSPLPRRIVYGSHPSQWCELSLPTAASPSAGRQQNELPVAVLVHGGSWTCKWCSDLHDAMASSLSEAGWAAYNMEFRKVGHKGQPEGQTGAGFPGTLEDIGAGLNALSTLAQQEPELGLDMGRVVLIGHSSGGHLALWAAQCHRSPLVSVALKPAAVVGLAPDSDLLKEFVRARESTETFMGCTPDERPEAYALADPMQLLPLGCKQLIVTGDDDTNTPTERTVEYAEAAVAAGDPVEMLQFKSLEDCAPVPDHFAVITVEHRIWPRILRAICSLVPGPDDRGGAKM